MYCTWTNLHTLSLKDSHTHTQQLFHICSFAANLQSSPSARAAPHSVIQRAESCTCYCLTLMRSCDAATSRRSLCVCVCEREKEKKELCTEGAVNRKEEVERQKRAIDQWTGFKLKFALCNGTVTKRSQWEHLSPASRNQRLRHKRQRITWLVIISLISETFLRWEIFDCNPPFSYRLNWPPGGFFLQWSFWVQHWR